MAVYNVTFVQYHEYPNIVADSREEAISLAEKDFISDMQRLSCTDYQDVEVEIDEDEE
jgi:hypothetical protein